MGKVKIIAATGCPTGIAHTFMAAESLKIAGKKLGVDIKVETHGQVGIENALTPEDIRQADGVIVAADKDVQVERFAGKLLIDVPVAQGIRDAEGLIQKIIDGKAQIYKTSSSNEEVTSSEKKDVETTPSFGRAIY